VTERSVSVLVVDDSALMRNLVSRIFESAPGFRVAGTAMNGAFALKKIEQARPDLIILDLEMPEMNGIEFLRERQKRGLDVPVIILSSVAEKGARITMEALSLGASDFVLKPGGVTTSQDLKDTAGELLELGRVYGMRAQGVPWTEAATTPRAPQREAEARAEVREVPPKGPERVTPLRAPGPVEVVAIGVSTGGPNALREVLPRLDPALPAPVLIVQHMPAGFTVEFAESLDKVCPLDVREAKDGDVVKPGRILVAPGNAHMTVEARPLARIVRLSDDPPVSGHRPSADVLFGSVARVYTNRCLAVIMTGMGRDGAAEIGSIYREGGITIAQDERSCIVYGMPRAAVEAGVIQHVVALPQMAETINRLSREHPPE
jgi:two-component system chemotaxis response regulator CheB